MELAPVLGADQHEVTAVPAVRGALSRRYGRSNGEGGSQAVRWTMRVRAQCGETSTVVVEVYRQSVWVSVVPSFNGEAILEPANVDSLVDRLVHAAQEARKYKP